MVTTNETRLTKELLDMSAGMSRLGILSKTAHSKITKRHLGEETAIAKPISGQEIKTLWRRSKGTPIDRASDQPMHRPPT